MQLHDFLAVTHNKENLINFLIEHHLINKEIQCPKCNSNLEINTSNLTFRCYKVYYEQNNHKKRVKKQCSFQTSAKCATWFSKSKLDLETVCRLTAYFIMLLHKRTTMNSTCSFRNNSLPFPSFGLLILGGKNSTKLGGSDKIVEIDEAKIGKRKFNCGRIIKGNWIFGGYERESGKIFLKPTQHIERVWREVRANIPRYGTRTSHLAGYLAEFLFKRVHKFEDRLNSFFCAIAQLYPPKFQDVSEAATST
ncbi:hypothetical protein X777_11059 [Ooceraea biroi]|uniref:ISXO2-like transposase domain-containing protein n=1 Tax=Ooceraea biroi TaxID=2015173 RepID=A0A026W702_OOCBI|nr:hypothetical protein X777_11059 [Ooceraea biroi]